MPIYNDMGKTTGRLLKPLPTVNALFLLLLVLEAGLGLFLALGHRIPHGHDGLQYFYLQYYFLNEAVTSGQIPQWIPYMTHGTVATWWYVIQAGFFQSVLALAAGFLKSADFIPLFYLGIFFDHLVLLTGTWLLSRRYFTSSLTVFFVSISVLGSAVWMDQPWWNFHFYYALPLTLHLLHQFLDSGKWRYALLVGNLLAVQTLGNLPYFIPVTTWVVFIYFLFHFFLNRREVWSSIKKVRLGWAAAGALAVTALSFAAAYWVTRIGTEPIMNYTEGRNPDGTTMFHNFLTYGANTDFGKWLEMVLRVSPLMDYTLYIGLLAPPMILLGLLYNPKRESLPILLTAAAVLLFSSGTVVASFFYHGWPMMRYYRHLFLTNTIAKLLFCFLAGFGFEAALAGKFHRRWPVILTGLFFLALALGTAWLARHYWDRAFHFIHGFAPGFASSAIYNEHYLTSQLVLASKAALISAALFFALAVTGSKHYLWAVITAVLLFHGADLYQYKWTQGKSKTMRLDQPDRRLTAFEPVPYLVRRGNDKNVNTDRASFLKYLFITERNFKASYGASYWSVALFLFVDNLGTPFRIDHWLRPLDQYMKAYWGQDIGDPRPPRGFVLGDPFRFPESHAGSLKIAGVTEDKIQFFSKAHFLGSDQEVAEKITDPSYQGDILFVSPVVGVGTDLGLDTSERLHVPYQIKRFNSNYLEVDVTTDVPSWMLYSDVWHPGWKAAVNGKPVPVYKANLAYKAVPLEPGWNLVHFHFGSQPMAALTFLIGLNALAWVVGVAGMAVKLSSSPAVNRST